MIKSVKVGKIEIGGDKLAVIAGPCVVESEELCLEVAAKMKAICAKLQLPYIFKASYDKANRTSADAFRGPGMERGLAALRRVKEELGVPVVTDVHEAAQVAAAAEVADMLQIPAFLCRQTDLLTAAAGTGKPVNVKKAQFLSPQAMRNVVEKLRRAGGNRIVLTERGSTFGYDLLVVDMTAIPAMRALQCPVVYDATHSLQCPAGQGQKVAGGRREFAAPLAAAAVAAGADGLFLEVHPDPARALSDPATSLDYKTAEELLRRAKSVFTAVRE